MDNRNTDTLMDLAAGEAIGANAPAETTAYHQELSSAGPEGARLDHSLRETAARIAAASPHLNPSADLRGRILQATAPNSFRMDDYRKAMREPARFYRWGLAAAMLFLTAAAYYNLTVQNANSALQNNNASLKTALTQLTAQANAMLNVNSEVLRQVIDPARAQLLLTQDGKLAAKAYVDFKSHHAVLVVPAGTVNKVPPGDSLLLALTDSKGEKSEFRTTVVEASPEMFQGKPPAQLDKTIIVHNMTPVEPQKTYQAGFAPNE